jgi:hypothetical protein
LVCASRPFCSNSCFFASTSFSAAVYLLARRFQFRFGHIPLSLEDFDLAIRFDPFLHQTLLPLVVDAGLPLLGFIPRDHPQLGL